jgi:hypothetical protein
MKTLFIVIVVAVLLAGIGFVGISLWCEWQPVWGYYQSARGYGPAESPDEAVERFLKAVKDRDYSTAAEFCTGEYADELKKTAPKARELAQAIDNFRHSMELKEIPSNKIKWILNRLQPFPKDFKAPQVKKQGEDTATVELFEDYGTLQWTDWSDWNVDQEAFRGCCGGLAGHWALPNTPTVVDVVKEGASWKLRFELTTPVRAGMAKVRDTGPNYIKALDKVSDEIKNHTVTKDGVEAQLKDEIQKAKPS